MPDERANAVLPAWLRGIFNATSFNLRTMGEGRGAMATEPEGTGFHLIWHAPTGLACPLARIYLQENDTVRRQRFWDNWLIELMEALAH